MEYVKLFFGIAFLTVFVWLLIRNSKRIGIMHSLFRIDTILGIVAGGYLIITSVQTLILQ